MCTSHARSTFLTLIHYPPLPSPPLFFLYLHPPFLPAPSPPQRQTFARAEALFQQQLGSTLAKHLSSTEQSCTALEEDLATSHAIARENLEFKISRMEVPRVKYSKRVIELTRSESELVRLKLYDDAAQVRRMLGKVQPQEEDRWIKNFEESISDMRTALHAKQEAEWVRLSEKTKGLRWNAIREKEKQEKNGVQRVVNHKHDMRHAQTHEANLLPEMSITPSAHWIKRDGYESSSAALRGQQFLLHVLTTSSPKSGGGGAGAGAGQEGKGKNKTGGGSEKEKVVYAASLTTRHSFTDHSNLQNTYTLQ